MVTDREFEEKDKELLAYSLRNDEYHKDTPLEFFEQPGTLTKVYSDENGIIAFARATKSLRIDIQFVDNDDRRRNAALLVEGFGPLAANASAAGFTELVFTSNSPELAAFCEVNFGYDLVEDKFVLRKQL